jgi:hypothetical protein
MIFLIGPAVAMVGLVTVFFVMRHKSVEKRSMYSSRRSQIEHKVRAARQRTLAPARRAEKGSHTGDENASPTAAALTYEPSAYAGPPVAPPPVTKTQSAPTQGAWDVGPTAPAPSTPAFTPPAPPFEPAMAEPSAPVPPASEPPWTPAPATPEPTQTQAAPEPVQSERPAPAPLVPSATSAGAGATWSVVGETKASAEPEPAPTKKSKREGQTGAWQLASGEVAGDEADEGVKKPSVALAVAQYAAFVLGLLIVLIGVIVTVANSHGT